MKRCGGSFMNSIHHIFLRQNPLRDIRRVFVAAVVVASCGTNDIPADMRRSSEPQSLEMAAAQPEVPSFAAMPKELRAAYIAAVQQQAPASYTASSLGQQRFLAENEAHRFATTFDRSGVVVSVDDAAVSMTMRAVGLGCEDAVSALATPEPTAEGNWIRYQREGLEEWYLNGPLGLEQGFVLSEPPACAGTKVVTIESSGDVRAELDDADGDGRGDALRFVDDEGRGVLAYTDLFVKDALGKTLPAWLSVEAGEIKIHVDDTGAVYPVEMDPLIGVTQAKLFAPAGGSYGHFSDAVAIDGDTVVVGAPYDEVGGNVNHGSVYVFTRAGGVWTQQQQLVAADGAAGDLFGYAVAISGDTALVGAVHANAGFSITDAGAVYVYVRSSGVWTQQQKLTAPISGSYLYFGCSVGLSGDTALVGMTGDTTGGLIHGSAYVFVRSGGVWTAQQKLTASDGEAARYFGNQVALDGNTALVGTYFDYSFPSEGDHAGWVYVFVRNGVTWTQQQKLAPSDGEPNDLFSSALALSSDTALVGAYADDIGTNEDQGSAYVFVRNGATWTQQQKLISSGGAAFDGFGFSVALSGDTALVGASGADIAGNPQGAAYVFVRDGVTWAQQPQDVVAFDGQPGDNFGRSVALSGDTAVVGASLDDIGVTDQGSAYVFVLRKANGDPCAAGPECASGICVEGVCCDTACGGGDAGDCQACSVAGGAAVNGFCAPIAAGTLCRVSAGDCDAAESCNGVSAACPADTKAAAG